MSGSKKFIVLLAVVGVAALSIVIYWNQHLYYKAQAIEDLDEKIEALERASRFYPLNDLAFYELGMAYYNLAEENLNDSPKSQGNIDKSIDCFIRSIRINPAFQFSHFYLGRSYLSKEVLSPSAENKYIDEYKRAALLVSQFADIYFSVGTKLLARWAELSEADKDFTLEMLREIWRVRDRKKILSILQTWEMNARDYEIMENILPEEEDAYYTYAKFLGERSLDLGERHKFLAKYEWLEFEKAKQFYDTGERDFFNFRFSEAKQNFLSCLRTLDGIKFYQTLTGQNLIDPSEVLNIRKSALLNFAKSLIEDGEDWGEFESYLREYMVYEDRVSAINELESYLVDQNLLIDTLGGEFDDLDRLSFQLLLYIRQNRYGEIVRLGHNIQSSFIVVPDEKKDQYVETLQIVGDAFQKNGSFYGARDFYRQALEIDPENLDTLLRLRKNLVRLNEESGVRDLDRDIAEVISPKEISGRSQAIDKGRTFAQSLLFDGSDIKLDLHFIDEWEDSPPLLSVCFNGKVIRENYLNDSVLSVSLGTEEGENIIQVTAVNRPVTLSQVTWRLNNIK